VQLESVDGGGLFIAVRQRFEGRLGSAGCLEHRLDAIQRRQDWRNQIVQVVINQHATYVVGPLPYPNRF
jgi:hypothetical protein